MKKISLLITLFLTLVACEQKRSHYDYDNDTTDSYEESASYEEDEEEYPDGTYEAEVEVYNPETGYETTYTLDVEVEDGELTKIYWNNGGWLDDSHFSPVDISDGSASFEDDRGRRYKVELN